MLNFQNGIFLKRFTTFKIGGLAHFFVEINNPAELPEAFEFAERQHLPVLVLGGGSNMLVSDSGFDGLVIHINNLGIVAPASSPVPTPAIGGPARTPALQRLWIASGEVWDNVVRYAVEHNLWGIENLSRIPGQAGAVAVQNVGAYGQEIKDVLMNVEVFDRTTKSFRTLTNEDCRFTYRKSIFNTTEKNRYVILYTTLQLSTEPKRNLSYPDVKKWFESNPEPTQLEIREAIKAIRDKKFPFPAESVEGNAGSFFKNSVLTNDDYSNLEKHFEKNLPEHLERLKTLRARSGETEIKIPSAFILEACELKGFCRGNVQLNPSQPVVVLNGTGNATAHEVLSLVKEVRMIVEEKTGLHLYTEPEIIGFTSDELRNYGFNADELLRYTKNE